MQQGSLGAAAMVMPHTAMYAADAAAAAAAASFSSMMPGAAGAGGAGGHLPTVPAGNSAAMMMMMNADDDGTAGWTAANAPTDVSNYLAAKAGHVVCTSGSFSTLCE